MHQCPRCKLEVKNAENFKRHIKVCDGSGAYGTKRPGPQTCQYCNKTFHSRGNYRRHVVHCKNIAGTDIQAEYDSGLSIAQLCEKYCIGRKFANSIIANKRENWKTTQELKDKEPEAYFFGGSRKVSKGEQRFEEMLSKTEFWSPLRIVKQYHLFGYRMDFAFPEIKLDIEIDGMQHYTKQPIKIRDVERDAKLIGAGWTVYRIASKDFLARSDKVFSQFYCFLSTYINKKTSQPLIYHKTFAYIGQTVDGDLQWAKEREEKILNSSIDFKKRGWTIELGKLLGIHSESALRWVRNNMPQFYRDQCRTPKADYARMNTKR